MTKPGSTICPHGEEPFTCKVCNIPPAQEAKSWPPRIRGYYDGFYCFCPEQWESKIPNTEAPKGWVDFLSEEEHQVIVSDLERKVREARAAVWEEAAKACQEWSHNAWKHDDTSTQAYCHAHDDFMAKAAKEKQ